jgi:hypothetical protein
MGGTIMNVEEEISRPSIEVYRPELLELSGGMYNPPSIGEVGDIPPFPGPLGVLLYLFGKLVWPKKVE